MIALMIVCAIWVIAVVVPIHLTWDMPAEVVFKYHVEKALAVLWGCVYVLSLVILILVYGV